MLAWRGRSDSSSRAEAAGLMMPFPVWCACQQGRIASELEVTYQTIQRRRLAREAQAYRARMWERVEASYGHLSVGIARDIRENRVEA